MLNTILTFQAGHRSATLCSLTDQVGAALQANNHGDWIHASVLLLMNLESLWRQTNVFCSRTQKPPISDENYDAFAFLWVLVVPQRFMVWSVMPQKQFWFPCTFSSCVQCNVFPPITSICKNKFLIAAVVFLMFFRLTQVATFAPNPGWHISTPWMSDTGLRSGNHSRF